MKNNKKGFTLAEVLITLGIVGTIATITLPSLMNNILVQELEAQFKKTVSDLHSFARYFQAQNDISVPLYTALNDSNKLFNEFQKYMAKSSKTSNWTWGNSKTTTMVYKYHSLTDPTGTTLTSSICDATGKLQDGNGRIYSFDDAPNRGFNGPRVCVDINGTKGPNTYGLDVFSFLFTTDGLVIPEGEPHPNSNSSDIVYDYDKSIGYAWKAGTTTGASNCYDSKFGQTCANFAMMDINPKNSKEKYWKDFVGKKGYLK